MHRASVGNCSSRRSPLTLRWRRDLNRSGSCPLPAVASHGARLRSTLRNTQNAASRSVGPICAMSEAASCHKHDDDHPAPDLSHSSSLLIAEPPILSTQDNAVSSPTQSLNDSARRCEQSGAAKTTADPPICMHIGCFAIFYVVMNEQKPSHEQLLPGTKVIIE
jgi:hypothetical protein